MSGSPRGARHGGGGGGRSDSPDDRARSRSRSRTRSRSRSRTRSRSRSRTRSRSRSGSRDRRRDRRGRSRSRSRSRGRSRRAKRDRRAVARVQSPSEMTVTDATRDLFKRALARLNGRLPTNVSSVNDKMRAEDPKWHVVEATGGTFSMLCALLEKEGLIKLGKKNASVQLM